MFKIEDKVKVKNDLIVGKTYKGQVFMQQMEKYKDEVFEIERIIGAGQYKLKNTNEWTFTDEMLKQVQESDTIMEDIIRENVKKARETINHPSHYNKGIEAIDVIESWDLNFSLGNALKYIVRAPYKSNTIEDLKKARWYVDREIERLEKISK